MSNTTSVTQLAINALNQSMSTDECLEYLTGDKPNFKTFSVQLRELIEETKHKDKDEKALIELIVKNLINFDKLEGGNPNEKSRRNSVAKWLKEGEPRKRKDVIKIAFALGFNLDQANLLLRKGYHDNDLSVRNAEDATFMYCLLNERPYNVAVTLLERFNKPNSKKSNKASSDGIYSGDTTKIMFDTLINSNWSSDDAFFDTFLNCRRNDFIGYSKTALSTYYSWYIELSTNILYYLESDQRNQNFGSVEEYYEHILKKFDEDPETTLADLRSKLSISKMIKELYMGIPYRIYSVRQKDGSLKKEGKHDSFKDSSLKDTIFEHYPVEKTFTNIEKNPEEYIFSRQTRNLMILFYYFNYAFSWFAHTDLLEKSCKAFITDLNTDLTNCGISPLYTARPFDWLIMYSILKYEDAVKLGDTSFDPSEFMNEVLEKSFLGNS